MTGEWRPVILGILRIESNYEVSSLGRVRNRKTGRVLKSFFIVNRSGDLYEKVDLYLAGLRHRRFVHRLVGEAFIPNPEYKPEINHRDTNTLNCAKDNLEWATRLENEEHKRFMRATA
jgi:hypothetical protein